MTRIALCVVVAICAACSSGLSETQGPETCYALKLKTIAADRIATLVARCNEYPSVADCPFAAGVNERFDRKSVAAKDECLNGSR